MCPSQGHSQSRTMMQRVGLIGLGFRVWGLGFRVCGLGLGFSVFFGAGSHSGFDLSGGGLHQGLGALGVVGLYALVYGV